MSYCTAKVGNKKLLSTLQSLLPPLPCDSNSQASCLHLDQTLKQKILGNSCLGEIASEACNLLEQWAGQSPGSVSESLAMSKEHWCGRKWCLSFDLSGEHAGSDMLCFSEGDGRRLRIVSSPKLRGSVAKDSSWSHADVWDLLNHRHMADCRGGS